MSTGNTQSRFHVTRRGLMLGTAGFAAVGIGMPSVLRAQSQSLKVGILHPVTGGLAYEGEQARKGALLALEEINAAGGIKSMNGAKIEAVLADAQSKPDVGAAEVDRLAEAGVLAIQGPFASGIALATTQAAAKHNLAHLVDVGVVDQIVTRGLPNTFRFAPGFGKITSFALERDTMSVPRRGRSFTNLGTISMQRRETPMIENRTVSASFGLET